MNRGNTIGVVIFRREGQSIKYLLLHKSGDYWIFPKGRPNPGETELETALRETREESGLTDVHIIDGFRHTYDYDFEAVVEDGVRETIYRQAIFFLGEVTQTDITISDEHIDFGWFDYDTASQRMYYQVGRDLLRAAHEFLLAKQQFVV
jgi:bis(5'-nucleosidyl)-tetraphosphatase